MTLGLTVVSEDVRNEVASGFEFSNWGERDSNYVYYPLKVLVQK